MSNLGSVVPQAHEVSIGGRVYLLKFTLGTFAAMERRYGGVEAAMRKMEEGGFSTIIFFLWQGLRSSDKSIDEEWVEDNVNISELTNIMEVLGDALATATPKVPEDHKQKQKGAIAPDPN